MRIAVTGAGGNVGGQIVDELAGHDVVPITRAVADYDDPAALRRALDGAETLVFVSSDGPVERVLVHHHNIVEAAAGAGVGHVVALSGLDVDLRSPFCYAVGLGHTERRLAASGCAVTLARASLYTEFFASFLGDRLWVPAGAGRISLVSRADVARCLAALALAPPGGCHEITGPEALDGPAIAARAGVEYADADPAEWFVALARRGEDPWWAYAYSSLFASVREHRWEATSDAVEALTGRPPQAFGGAGPAGAPENQP